MCEYSENEENKTNINEISLEFVNFIKGEIQKNSEEEKEVIGENTDDIIIPTFVNLLETFLTEDVSKLSKFNITLTPDIQKYFLIIFKTTPELFKSIEETIQKIVLDNKINTKDIPYILMLVHNVYDIIYKNKGFGYVNPYEVIKTLLHLAFIAYIETNKVENSQLLIDMLLNIIDSSIELIKLSPIKSNKYECINKLFRR